MKNGLKGLLAALAIVSFANASDSNNKTHLNVRVARDRVPAYTTFHEMTHVVKKDSDIGGRGNVEATAYYGRSDNGKHLAKNFGANGTDRIQVIGGDPDQILDLNGKAGLVTSSQAVNDLLLHKLGVGLANTLAGWLRFDPRQTAYGVRLDYFQRFDKWFEGLFARLIVPFAHVRNDLNMTTECTTDEDSVKLHHLFTGQEIDRTADANKHTALKYARMCSNSDTGISDIEALVGWNFLEHADYHAGIHLGVVLPTGSKPDARYLWSARVGEGKWGIRLGLDGDTVLWRDGERNFKLVGSLIYKYLFSGKEMRTLGLEDLRYRTQTAPTAITHTDLVKFPMLSQYYLIGTKDATGLQPLANVSTLNMNIKPGSQIDMITAFAYNSGNFTLDFGYNLFWKEAERATLKGHSREKCACPPTTSSTSCDPCNPGWENEKYGVATKDYNATDPFAYDDTLYALSKNGYTDINDFYLKGVESAAQLVHKFFTGIGYVANAWDYPVLIGAGAAYEVPSNNRDAAQGYSFWAKAGIAF